MIRMLVTALILVLAVGATAGATISKSFGRVAAAVTNVVGAR